MTTLAPSRLDAAFDVVEQAVARTTLPSAVLAVADAQSVIRIQAFGPAREDSIFAIASITKPIFCTALMQLVERGLLLLNEPVTRLVPEFGAQGKGSIVLWHLLTHTSGLDENWTYLSGGSPTHASCEQIVKVTCRAPLLFTPGSQYSYCNPSFLIMAEMMKRATGESHEAQLHARIFEPLHMASTSFAPPEAASVMPVLDPPWRDDAQRAAWIASKHPAGGLFSTADDLVRFGQMLLRRGAPVLSPAAFQTMTSLHTAGIPNRTGQGEFASYYGLGFTKSGPGSDNGPSAELRTPQGFGHGGATGTYLWVEPALDLVFVFLTNRWGILDETFRRALNATIAARSAGP